MVVRGRSMFTTNKEIPMTNAAIRENYMDMQSKEAYLKSKKVGVLFGNRSIENKLYTENAPDSERGIVSIENCLKKMAFNYSMIDTTQAEFINEIKKCEVVFVYMHGEYGEDGRIQGLLDYLETPYTGPGVLPNAIGLNKVIFKHCISSLGIATPPYHAWNKDIGTNNNLLGIKEKCHPAYMLKPTCGGSSIGISKHRDLDTIETFFNNPHSLYEDYFVESYIEGKMVTSGVFEVDGNLIPLPLLEVNTGTDFYDEKTKLNRDQKSRAEFHVPAMVSDDITRQVKATSRKMFQNLGYKGFARFDYIIDREGRFYCLEVNSIPGLAENSNFTRACNHIGIEYKEIIVNLLWNAIHK